MRLVLILLCLMGGIMSQLSSERSEAQEPFFQSERLSMLFEPREYRDAQGKVLNYRLMKPIDFRPELKYPLVVFLHGAGERGDDNQKQLKWGMREFSEESLRKKYPSYILVPQCPENQKWVDVDWTASRSSFPAEPSPSIQLVRQVIGDMLESSGVDARRIYIVGLSMGGYGTWDVVARYSDLFAAAAPICGGGDPETVNKFLPLPIWCFHGAADTVVPPSRSRQMVEALKKLGAEPKYTEYPGVGHDSWSPTFANPDFFEWMYAQRKKAIP